MASQKAGDEVATPDLMVSVDLVANVTPTAPSLPVLNEMLFSVTKATSPKFGKAIGIGVVTFPSATSDAVPNWMIRPPGTSGMRM